MNSFMESLIYFLSFIILCFVVDSDPIPRPWSVWKQIFLRRGRTLETSNIVRLLRRDDKHLLLFNNNTNMLVVYKQILDDGSERKHYASVEEGSSWRGPILSQVLDMVLIPAGRCEWGSVRRWPQIRPLARTPLTQTVWFCSYRGARSEPPGPVGGRDEPAGCVQSATA